MTFQFQKWVERWALGLRRYRQRFELELLVRGPQLPFERLRIAVCLFVSLLYVALNIACVRRDVPRLIADLVIIGSVLGVYILRFVLERRKVSSGVVAAGS